MSSYPLKLQEIIDFFEHLSDVEKRENLIAYADEAHKEEPREGESFDLEDVRKDEECTDTVGIFLKLNEGKASFRVTLGPHVQTLTRAMTAILCQVMNECSPESILAVEQDFVPKIVGTELVRVRSQTVYYILTRMKNICKIYLTKLRANTIP